MECVNLREELLLRMLNIPYQWGKDNPLAGFDCSGLTQYYLAQFGLDPLGDQTAQGLYDYFVINGAGKTKDLGALAFYGKNLSSITHVAIHLNPMLIVEAGGGGSLTTTYQKAMEQGACVRVRPVNHRKDYLDTIMVAYPAWVING